MAKAAKKEEVEIEQGEHEFLEFTISGSYYNSKKEIVDFDNIKGKIPVCDEENGVGSMHVRGRFAARWIKDAKDANDEPRYPERVHKLRQVHIDDVQPATGEYSFSGKNIKELNVNEMQELAVAKDLRFIPLPEAGYDLRDMRTRTYVAYAEKVLKKKIKFQDEDFNFAKLPAIFLDASLRRETSLKLTNEEIIEQEQKGSGKAVNYGEKDDPKNRFTLEELKTLADTKNIEYPEDIEFDDLYSQLFTA